MKWLVFLFVFSLVLTGFLAPTLAASEAGHDHAPTKLHVGVKQPDVIKEKATLPGKVEIVEPQPLSKVTGATVTLKWKPSQGATVYHIQVATDPRFKWLVSENHNVAGESYEVSNLQQGQQYFWRVAGRAPENDASWTKGFFATSSFEVK